MKDWLCPLIAAGFALGLSFHSYPERWCIFFAWMSGVLSTLAFVAYVQYKADQFHYRP